MDQSHRFLQPELAEYLAVVDGCHKQLIKQEEGRMHASGFPRFPFIFQHTATAIPSSQTCVPTSPPAQSPLSTKSSSHPKSSLKSALPLGSRHAPHNFTVSTAFSFKPSSAVPISFKSFCLIPVSHTLLVIFPSSSLHSSQSSFSASVSYPNSLHTLPLPIVLQPNKGMDVLISSLNLAFVLSSPSVSSYFHLCG